MRAVVQRVDGASVAVVTESGTETVGEIVGEGLCVLVGVTHEDTPEQAERLARKLWSIRILEGEKSCSEVNAPLLVISQFTLFGDARGQRRPSFIQAAAPELGKALYEEFVRAMRALGVQVETGVFQAHMAVELVNDGPVTILLDSDKTF